MPEELFLKLKKNILPQWKWCFLSALIIGLVAHLYKITNWLPNWDSLVFRYDEQNMVSMGRWFLPVVSAFSSHYDLPFLTGLLAILFHGLAGVYICKMFSVKKNITAVLIGAAVVSFPTVTSVMLYNYVADAYSLSFLFACIAAFFMTKEKPKYFVSVVFIALSVGIYQAYITVTIMLVLCYLILEVLRKDANIKNILIKSGKCFLTGAVGMILYYLVLIIVLKITGTELLEYQGFESAASLSGLDIWGSLYTIRESFLNYFFDFSNGLRVFHFINIFIVVAAVFFYLFDIVHSKLKISNILLLIVFVVLLPVGASILAFINSGIDYHNLMKMGFFVFYLFFILQYEKEQFKNKQITAGKLWFVLGLSAVLIFNQIIIANVSYHKLTIAYEKTYGTLIRVTDRIEQTEGTDGCTRMLVLGALSDSEAYSSDLPPVMTGTTDGYILRADDEVVGQSVFVSAINDYCGKNYDFVSGEEKVRLLKKIDMNDLSNWPEKNSVLVVDDVIVVKLGD